MSPAPLLLRVTEKSILARNWNLGRHFLAPDKMQHYNSLLFSFFLFFLSFLISSILNERKREREERHDNKGNNNKETTEWKIEMGKDVQKLWLIFMRIGYLHIDRHRPVGISPCIYIHYLFSGVSPRSFEERRGLSEFRHRYKLGAKRV